MREPFVLSSQMKLLCYRVSFKYKRLIFYHLRRWILLFPWKTTNPLAVNPRKAVEPVKSCVQVQ